MPSHKHLSELNLERRIDNGVHCDLSDKGATFKNRRVVPYEFALSDELREIILQ